jgi:hypothetical protein
MKLPSAPCKKSAAIGGAARINVVRINPKPLCWMAWVLRPYDHPPGGKNWSNAALPHSATKTPMTMSSAFETSTAVEYIVLTP